MAARLAFATPERSKRLYTDHRPGTFAAADVFLRINGYSISADPTAIYDFLMKLFGEHTFDMEHPVPWLQENVRSPSRGSA